jgi:hypothetical protein
LYLLFHDRINAMPEEKRTDDVEKFLAEQKILEDRKQAIIEDLLRQREAVIAAFDEKLAKLGYHGNSGKSKKSHHKKSAAATPDLPAKSAAKPKA